MSNIKLVTDESADVPVELIREFDIGIVKLNVAFGDEDVSHLSNSEFYEKMKKSSILPKTSASSPERFVEQYRTDQDVIVVTLAGKLSSTYSAAKLAKDMHYAEGGKNKIEIIDSFNGCIGASALIYMAGQMAREGKPFEEIVGKVMELRDNLLHYGVLETLENAIKGGRVNRTQGFLANALNIKAVVEIKDSAVKPIDKARGTKNAVKKVVDIFVNKLDEKGKDYHYTTLFLAHANSPDKIDLILEELKNRGKTNFEQTYVSEIGTLMGTYTSEGAFWSYVKI